MRIGALAAMFAGMFVGQVAAGEDLRAVVGLTSYGYTAQVSVNGKKLQLPHLKGGASEVVQLFAVDHPQKEKTVPELRSVFCLKRGQNTIKVEYKQVDARLAALPISLYMSAQGYSSNVFELTLPKAESGTFETVFEVYGTEPASHKTQRQVRRLK